MRSLPSRLFTLCSLTLTLALAGCAATRPELVQVRALAMQTSALNAFSELSQRHLDSYRRSRPYLSPQQDAQARLLAAQERAAHADVTKLVQAIRLYLQALGQLARDDVFDLRKELNSAGSALHAWPDSGINDRHVTAYATLLGQLSRLAGRSSQQAGLAQMLQDGDAPLQELLGALDGLLKLYDKSGDNERDIVLGLLEIEIAYADTPQQRLLTVLAASVRQDKSEEYRLFGLRHTLARQQLGLLAREHGRLAMAVTETQGAAP